MSNAMQALCNGDNPTRVAYCKAKIKESFRAAGVTVRWIEISKAPTVTRYRVYVSARVSAVVMMDLERELEPALDSPHRVRLAESGENPRVIYVEVVNKEKTPILLRHALRFCGTFERTRMPMLCLGVDVDGAPVPARLDWMPHLLVTGMSGSGKSVLMNLLISQLAVLASPERVNFVLFDPKRMAFSLFSRLPHLLCPVVHDAAQAGTVFETLVDEMRARFELLKAANASNIEAYNSLANQTQVHAPMSYTVLLIDEIMELMLTEEQREINTRLLCLLAKKGPSVGIHLVIGTQHLSPILLPRELLLLIPARIACRLLTQIDSKFALGVDGAETLCGNGDALYLPSPDAAEPTRLQIAYVSPSDIKTICG